MGLITERCRECDSAHFKYRCDFNDCNKVSNDESPVQLDFGYGSKRDTENWYFCSDECFERWLIEWFLQDKVIRKEDAPDRVGEICKEGYSEHFRCRECGGCITCSTCVCHKDGD